MDIIRKYTYSIHNLSYRLRYHRKLSDKLLCQLCEDAGITSAHWYSIEKGRVKTLPEETLQSIEQALGKSLSLSVPGEPILLEDEGRKNVSVPGEPPQSQSSSVPPAQQQPPYNHLFYQPIAMV